jgi:hypothetical protein
MGHSQGKPYVWRRALARMMTDAPETTWRSSCQLQQAYSVPGFHNCQQQNGQQKTKLRKDSARASRRHFLGTSRITEG